MRFGKFVAAVALSAALASTAHAGTILQDLSSGGSQILAASPIGQTFTAEDANIESIGVWISDANASFGANDYDLDMTLRVGGGAGTGTTLLTATNNTLSDGFSGWLDFDFSSVLLTVGDLYNFQVSNDNERWFVSTHQHSFPNGTSFAPDYAGGDMFLAGTIRTIQDLRFRVTVGQSVPAPAGVILFGLGLLALGARRKRT